MKLKREKPQPITRDEEKTYAAERKGLERDILSEILKSRKTAWNVAKGASALGVLGIVVAVMVIYRYAQPLPAYENFINKDTGEVTQVKMSRDEASYGELIDQYWLGQFVIHSESYDYATLQVDYDAMSLMAEGDVADSYLKQFKGPDAIQKKLGDSQYTRVKINSVILDREHGVATVRYTTTKRYRQRPQDEAPQYWIATMAYEYKKLPMTAQQRYINPLGFRVTSFRRNLENANAVGG